MIAQDKIAGLSAQQLALLKAKAQRKMAQLEEKRQQQLLPGARDRDEAPLSFAQKRLWFLDQLEPGNPFYNIPSAFRLYGHLDLDALERAFSEMIAQHEILRTVFRQETSGGEQAPSQRILPPFRVSLAFDDLLSLRESEREPEARRLLHAEVAVPFDLGRPPLWRARLIRIHQQDCLLVLTMHHIIFDGWSLGVFIRELSARYQAQTTGLPSPYAVSALQYRDFVSWHERELSESARVQQLSYWKKQLGGSLPILELPTDRPRPVEPSFHGHFHSLILPKPLYLALKKLGQEREATLFMCLLAAFKALLHRYSEQDDLIVGFPISGRHRPGVENMIGIFTNTLPLRTDLSGDPDFLTLLGRVRKTALEAYEHQEVPFESIVEAVRPERHLANNPLFQVLFTYQNSLGDIELPELKLVYRAIDGGTAKFDLSLDVFEGPDGPTCIFEYSTDLYDAGTIERMAGHYQTLLESLVRDPDIAISRLPMLTAAEQYEQLHEWNPLPRPFQGELVPSMVLTAARENPEGIAVVCGEDRLSYAGLVEGATRLAAELRARGVGPGCVVGLHLEKSLELAVAVLAVLRSGAAFVPLNPTIPAELLAFIAADAGVVLTLTHPAAEVESAPPGGGALLRLSGPDGRVVEMGEERTARKNLGEDALEPMAEVPLRPEFPAYVIYTSGTTGRPKGTVISHGAWANAYRGWESAYELRDRVRSHLQMARFSFDVFCGDFSRALCSGGKLVMCHKADLLEPARLYELIRREEVQCAEFVPIVFRHLVEHLEAYHLKLPTLKVNIVASDSWYVQEYRRFREPLDERARLINSYGLTEATIDSTWFEGDLNGLAPHQMVPIGRPFPNSQVYLLDRWMQPVPVGSTGELYIGGLGLALGYLNRPDLTAHRFVPNPFHTPTGSRLYRTGDQGRYLPDGRIELRGRIDFQVKIRGYRIELGEIETALLKHPAIREAAVVVREDTPGDKHLIAYLVSHTPLAHWDEELRSFLGDKVPDYMIPEAFVALNHFPVNSSGKLDRAALPKPKLDASAQDHYQAPRTLTEELLAEIWAHVFSLHRVSTHADFFRLGGHSILAMQIIGRIRQVFQVDLPLKTFFKTPVLSALAQAIADLKGQGESFRRFHELPEVLPDPSAAFEPFPLTDVQQAYWIGRNAEFELGNVSTHNYEELSFADLDLERLQLAWNRMIDYHPMLRAVVDRDGRQRILESVPPYEVPVLDLRGMSGSETAASLAELRAELSHQVLDTARWPVFDVRVTLLDHTSIIHFSLDSITFDAWSFVVLLNDLARVYREPEVVLPELPFTFRDYVLGEQQLKGTPLYEHSQAYWHKRVPELAPAPELPLARTPGSLANPRFKRMHRTLEPAIWKKLQDESSRRRITDAGVLLAAYAEVLATWAKQRRFSLDLTFLNRLPFHPTVNEIVGEFTSVTILGIDPEGATSFEGRARRIQEQLWQDLEHPFVSGVEVLREMRRLHGGGNNAKMPVVFTGALNLPIPEAGETPLALDPEHSITQTSQVYLDCGVWEDSGRLFCNWDVVEEMFPPGMLDEMQDAYWGLVERLATDAETSWSALAPVSLPRRQQAARARYNDTAGELPTRLLHERVLEAARTFGHAPAVIAGETVLDYDPLRRLTARIARRLRAMGAKPNQLVAVVMDKGWEQVAAVLGILQAGAAYLPIDSGLPESRIHYLLKNGEVSIALIQPGCEWRISWPEGVTRLTVTPDCCPDEEEESPVSAQKRTDLAYVIFTSGSTGQPKGVMIDHLGAANTIEDLNERHGIGPGDRVLALSRLNFDLSVYDIFGILAAGGAVVLPDAGAERDPAHWLALLKRQRVTLWNSVPALFAMLVRYCEDFDQRLPESLRLIWLSGDWIPLDLAQRARALTAVPLEIIGMGGATEASIWSIHYPIGAVRAEWTSIPYGMPMRNQSFHVLDEFLEPRPDWVPGSLYIGGIGLAKGYWRDPEKTAAAFVHHPRTGERLYRTGDLGRMSPEGWIEFLGRDDFQVKIQGYRIELGEIESALLQFPGVRQAVAAACGPARGNKRLVAYLVCETPMSEGTAALEAFLAERLPEYMIPTAFHFMDQIPLSSNGKVDRKALPALEFEAGDRDRSGQPPESEMERILCEIWQELLGRSGLGIHDDFYELGGDSMTAIHQLKPIRERLGIELPLRDFFSNPTIASVAKLAERERERARLAQPELA